MEQFLQNLDIYLMYIAAFLGACTVAAKGLEPLVKLTATDKDDVLLAKVNLLLQKLSTLFSSVGSLTKPKPE
jgi:hypothetical protein